MISKPKPYALVFDWGNTVMKEFDEYQGAMIDWPTVEAIPGIGPALEQLQTKYRLFLGTNAQNSNTEQIRLALQRVNIESYFESIFTFKETQARKPEIGFYRAIERRTGEFRDQMLMIGDLYDKDITGAKLAGWKAVWYNAENKPCPGCLPMHDMEISEMQALPEVLLSPALPEVTTCLLWLQQNNAPAHLLAHVQMVAAIAYQLAVWLRAAGISVNPILAHRGGLLHDIAKAHNSEGVDHGESGGALLRAKGEPILADIADHHMLFTLLDEKRRPLTWEEKLVYYADKLVEKNEVVPIEQRLAGLQERYQIDSEILFSELTPRIKELEGEICTNVGSTPQSLLERIFEGLRG